MEWIAAVLMEFGVERSEVVGDEVIALDAAFQGGPGILQIAGPAPTQLGARRTGAASARAATVRGWATRAQGIGSACIACAGR